MAYRAGKTLEAAMQGDATAAADLWRAIDSGLAPDDEALTWMRKVAGRVVTEVLDADFKLGSNRRPDAALKSIGFYGQIKKQKSTEDQVLSFCKLTPDSSDLERASLITVIQDIPEYEGRPDKHIAKRIYRVRKKHSLLLTRKNPDDAG